MVDGGVRASLKLFSSFARCVHKIKLFVEIRCTLGALVHDKGIKSNLGIDEHNNDSFLCYGYVCMWCSVFVVRRHAKRFLSRAVSSKNAHVIRTHTHTPPEKSVWGGAYLASLRMKKKKNALDHKRLPCG